MRIISGIFKGKSINFRKSKITRPLKDSVRENIFNIILHSNKIKIKLEKADILDLYSGIGSFGLECISRNANSVTFVEEDKTSISILKKNLEKFSVFHKAKIINRKIEDIKNWNHGEKFNLFFFDPPFADKDFILNLDNIRKSKIFTNKHLVIIHREKKSDDKFDNYLNILLKKKYGRSKIIFGEFS